jgi:hypothetical protein
LHATFEELRLTFPWQIIAQIYLYLFLALFIFAVLNILVFVVDDAFEAAKNWDRKAWKERQTFTLANLIAILELEGKELKVTKYYAEEKFMCFNALFPFSFLKGSSFCERGLAASQF